MHIGRYIIIKHEIVRAPVRKLQSFLKQRVKITCHMKSEKLKHSMARVE